MWSHDAREMCSYGAAIAFVCREQQAWPSLHCAEQDAATPGSGLAARLAVRAGRHRGTDGGAGARLCAGQSRHFAAARWPPISCASASAIPKPCPLIGTSAPGDWRVPELGEDLDIRTDLPRYRVWRNGELVAEPEDIARVLARRSGELRHRLLVFVRGSADGGWHRAAPHHARLQRADVPHLDRRRMKRARSTGRWWCRCGRLTPADAIRAVQITTRFPSVHGAPVHIGKPELIGIADVMQAGLRRRGGSARRRTAGVLGLRGDAAIGDRDGEAGILHHALSRQHAGDGPEEYRICDYVVSALCSRFEFE